MKTLSGKRRSVKAIAFILTLALILPMLPALPSFAAVATKFTKITFKDVFKFEDTGFYFFDGDDEHWLEELKYDESSNESESFSWGSHTLTAKKVGDDVVLVGQFGTKANSNFTFYVWYSGSDKNFAVNVTDRNGTKKVYTAPSLNDKGYYPYTLAPGDFSIGDITIEVSKINPTYTVTLPSVAEATNYELSGYGSKPVTSGDNFSFTVTVEDPSDVPYVRAFDPDDNATVLPSAKDGNEYTYTLTSVNKDYRISIQIRSAVSITYSGSNADTFDVVGYEGTNVYQVPYGGTLKFDIVPETGYTVFKVSVNGAELQKADGYYTLTNVTKAVSVNVVTRVASLNVTFECDRESDAYEIRGTLPNSVTYNGEVRFTIAPTNGYTAPTVTYSVNGAEAQPINPEGNTYTISNVTGNITIKVREGGKESYKVNIPGGNGYTVSVAGTVTDGSDLTVTVTLEAGYTQSTPQLVIGGVPHEMRATDKDNEYTYTIENVTSAVSGYVTGVARNTYNVTFPAATADYTVSSSATVKHGETYSFTITPAVGYNAPAVSYTVEGGTSETITPDGNTYTIPKDKVTGNITIKITPADRTVTRPPDSDMYIIDCVESVKYGDKLTFTVTLTNGYTQSTPVVSATMNGSTQTLVATGHVGAKYTYTVNVTGNVAISVTGITQKNTYDVTLPASATGYTVSALTNTVRHGSSYSFTVTPATGYGVPIVSYTVDDSLEIKEINSTDNTYTIPEVTGNINIQITAGGLIDCKIIYDENSSEYGITIDGDAKTVKYSQTLQFTVTMLEGYTQTAPTVTVTMGNSTLTPAGTAIGNDQYTYTVSNVTGDVTISVTATKNTYTVTYPTAGNGFTASASSTTVAHNGDFVLTVRVEDGFDPATLVVSGATPTKSVNGQIVTVTISGVTSDLSIDLTVEKKNATITVRNDANIKEVTVDAENNKVEYGTGFNVTVKPAIGYKVISVSVVNDSNKVATALVQTSESTPGNSVWYCDGVNYDNATIVVNIAPITVTVNWIAGGRESWNDTFKYGSSYFENEKLTLNGFVPTRYGFEFASWSVSDHTIEHEDITVTVTGNWKIKSELFTLTTTVTFDPSVNKLVFSTTVVISEQADDEAQRDYAHAAITVAGCGFFYGGDGSVLNNDGSCISLLKDHLANVDWSKHLAQQAVAGFEGKVYFYNSTKEQTSDFEVGKNTYTVNFNFKNPAANISRSGVACLYVTIGEENVILLGDAVAYYGN